MSGARLSAVVDRLERAGLVVHGPAADLALDGIADDSRAVQPGNLFCAWAGTRSDAHRFLPAAERAGAAAALVERHVEESALPQVVVRDGRRAAGIAAQQLYGDPAAALRVVGITGTNGKTTTAWILRHLMGTEGEAASIGTLGAMLNDGVLPGTESLTTPGPVALAKTLRRLADRGVRSVAMEVSSHALEQGRVDALALDAAVFTNLSRDHLDYHGTFEAYRAAKLRMLELLKPDGTAVVNADAAAFEGIGEVAPRSMTFGVEAEGADVRAEELRLGGFGARFRLASPGGSAETELPLLGAYNVQNALGAAAACLALGWDVPRLAERLATTPQVPGRLERVAGGEFTVLTDYAHTPDALERSLEALRPLAAGRLIVVFGAGGDRDRGKRPLMGRVAELGADIAVVTSDNPRTEDPDAIIGEVVSGMERVAERETDRRRAIARALELADAGDIVLLAGKGHETYQVLGTEKTPFDEREIVRELLRERGLES